ncbi:cysteine dioxygenase [Streptomyces bathyalis]|nr:cysteine dioxygenase family protein [Streptomyces bathyalis]
MNSDIEIAGDPLALPHLMPPAPGHPSTVAGFAGMARTIAADRPGWQPLVRYDPATRWYHRLRTGPGYEVWLLSWLPGQGSGRHDHGQSSGVFTVLEGELTEHAGGVGRTLRPDDLRAFAPGYVHEVVNLSLLPVVSLHIYFPGLTEMPMRPPHARTGVAEVAACTAAPATPPAG